MKCHLLQYGNSGISKVQQHTVVTSNKVMVVILVSLRLIYDSFDLKNTLELIRDILRSKRDKILGYSNSRWNGGNTIMYRWQWSWQINNQLFMWFKCITNQLGNRLSRKRELIIEMQPAKLIQTKKYSHKLSKSVTFDAHAQLMLWGSWTWFMGHEACLTSEE